MSLLDVFVIAISNSSSDSALTTDGMRMAIENDACFVYLRQYDNQCCLVALNFSTQDQVLTLPEQSQGRILLSTHVDREELIPLSEISLRANEGLLIEVED